MASRAEAQFLARGNDGFINFAIGGISDGKRFGGHALTSVEGSRTEQRAEKVRGKAIRSD